MKKKPEEPKQVQGVGDREMSPEAPDSLLSRNDCISLRIFLLRSNCELHNVKTKLNQSSYASSSSVSLVDWEGCEEKHFLKNIESCVMNGKREDLTLEYDQAARKFQVGILAWDCDPGNSH